ncbi:PREDICTED: wall-associated receptor kinase-like 20 [Nicotiana attenuata]|uniref:Wall-associated receptor kinase-like 20 n=1 Tax=Nicotiana attenuata TaxID=49451 RepID=A0A1J6J1F0_NICAT|nr:PREDICTED: wall-associated receptor kinase-like 20 [Nicotiana attenuata]OIT01129.1 wall-associated receptor kinase-like 20 [Nicotiana attenuata]
MEKTSFLIITFFVMIINTVLSYKGTMPGLICGNCGKTPVPYPLSTGPNCGDQSYKVRCSAGTLWFDTKGNSSYVISSISPQIQKMVVKTPTLYPNTCLSSDFYSEGIQLDPNLPFNITGSNTILLLNCTDNMLHLQAPINCSSTCICHPYVNKIQEWAACRRQSLCCIFRTGGSQNEYMIRLNSNGCMAYQSFVGLDTSLPIEKWPQPGLELMWQIPDPPACKNEVDCNVLPFSKCLGDPKNPGKKRCVCKSGRYWDAQGYCQKCRHGTACKIQRNKAPLIAVAVVSVFLMLLGGFLVHRRYLIKRRTIRLLVKEREEILSANTSGKSAKVFSGKEIKKSTNYFDKENLLGSGGFGEVFKGTLEDGTIVAVKRAKPGNAKGTLQVLNEVRILCQVNHRGLVRLLGCCVELELPLLIYEYIPNGTLFEHLHGFRLREWAPLSWLRRLVIGHQTADGLAYLHSSAVPPIYHRDVKSSNILLDNKLDAKVSDFGLSRLVELSESDNTHINTTAQGTLGYLDPEYYLNLQLTDRSDVYSFGVVLLELLTSKKAIDFNRDEEDVNLVVYMKRIMDQEKLMDVIDPFIKEGASKVEMETIKAVGNLATACLDDRRQNRPSMKEVAEELEYVIGIVTGQASKS